MQSHSSMSVRQKAIFAAQSQLERRGCVCTSNEGGIYNEFEAKYSTQDFVFPIPYIPLFGLLFRGKKTAQLTSVFTTKIIQNMAPKAVMVVGHSFIKYLVKYIRNSNDPRINSNFNLDVSKLKVSTLGQSGCNIARFRRFFFPKIHRNKPDILYLELGTNDLDCVSGVADLVSSQLVDLVQDIHQISDKTFVIVGQVLKRGLHGTQDPDFNGKIVEFNEMTSQLINALPYGLFWRPLGCGIPV